ncbi:MAG TPA: MFS transporter, partial [Candidatus Sulfotelmatobacter sp.]|nr:MFS transporter [Candidatus Sulfotelmatobacter sp.]
ANTETETRARMGGLAILMIGVGSFFLPRLGGTDAITTSFLLGLWRTTCLVVLFFIKPTERKIEQKDFLSYRPLVLNRSFLLYFIPWIMFTLVNDLTYPVTLKAFPSLVENGTIIESILAGVFSVVYGFAADRIGRKRVILLAFALLGVGYGALGFGSGNEGAFWFYTAVDGIAWGALSMIFIMTVWGDLAQTKGSEKFYVLGSLPYLLSNLSRLTIGNYLADTVPGAAVFSFAGFFLFAAVLPLFLAPETLPEKIIKDNEMKTYLEKAQKIVMKTQNEDGKKPLKGYEEIKLEIEIRQEEFEKSEELAEECY